jgi:fructose-bisphosphate aldolase, class II
VCEKDLRVPLWSRAAAKLSVRSGRQDQEHTGPKTKFVDLTHVDVLAPAVGNMHGMLKSMVSGDVKKRLDIERIVQIKKATQVLLTLHGGSGTDDQDLRRAIAAGINVVHINTELRVAWRRGLQDALTNHPEEVVPYKILPFAVEAVKRVALSRLKLFNKLVA